MRKAVLLAAVSFLPALLTAGAARAGLDDELLDRLAGSWVMEGTIAGQDVTHDIDSEWVLGHNYIRLHELSREKDESGGPAYEAIVFIGKDPVSGGYACLWLDQTGGGGLVGDAIGHAVPGDDEIPFVFGDPSGGVIYNTFSYDRDSDTWSWAIDVEKDGQRSEFARVSLRRKR